MEIDFNDPEVVKAIEEKANSIAENKTDELKKSITNLETKNEELLGEKRTLAEKYKDIDPEKYKNLMDHLESSEEAKLISEGKTDEVIARRTEKFRKEMDERFNTLNEELNTEKAISKSSEERLQSYAVEVQMRKAAEKAGVLPEAIDDVILYSGSSFKLDKDMNAYMIDGDGDPKLDGKGQPVTPLSHITDLKENKAHWWPSSKGGKFQGNLDYANVELASELQKALDNGDHAKYREIRQQMQKAS